MVANREITTIPAPYAGSQKQTVAAPAAVPAARGLAVNPSRFSGIRLTISRRLSLCRALPVVLTDQSPLIGHFLEQPETVLDVGAEQFSSGGNLAFLAPNNRT
jgi:hypothetical protein